MKIGPWEVSKPSYLPDFDQLSESSQPLSSSPQKNIFLFFFYNFTQGVGLSEMNNKMMNFPEKPEIELDLTHGHYWLCNLPAD